MEWEPFNNKHKGERCFILGNAPNLVQENLNLLKDETIFITNRGYKAREHGLTHYNYHVVVDQKFYDDYADELYHLEEGVKFYPELFHTLPNYRGEDHVKVIYRLPKWHLLGKARSWPKKYSDGWGKTGNAVLQATMIASFMGFKEIYLLGVEMIYKKGATHFYKDTSEREQNVPDGHRSKGPDFIPVFVSRLGKKGIKFVNLTRTFPYKDLMECSTLEKVIKNAV